MAAALWDPTATESAKLQRCFQTDPKTVAEWAALQARQTFCDLQDKLVAGRGFPRTHIRAAFHRMQSAGVPATMPNSSMTALVDLWC